jgi:hypothetical protein
MSIEELLAQIVAALKLPHANTIGLSQALTNLKTLLPVKETVMTTPNVQIAQADLDKFATEFNAVFTALKGFIATLQANQVTPLSAADESGLAAALAAGEALEPPSGA